MIVLTTDVYFGQEPLKLKGDPSPEGIFHADTILQLRCRIIGGGANNQLLTEDDSDFAQAKQRAVHPHRLAVTLAQERIQAVRELRRLNAAA